MSQRYVFHVQVSRTANVPSVDIWCVTIVVLYAKGVRFLYALFAWSGDMVPTIVGKLIASREVKKKMTEIQKQILRVIICSAIGMAMLFLLSGW